MLKLAQIKATTFADLPEEIRQHRLGEVCETFFEYYNHEHRHSGIALHTPADVHFGLADAIREKRQSVLDDVYAIRPDRFRKPPQAPRIPDMVWINRPDEEEATIAI